MIDAIRNRDWPAALDAALDRWRAHRTVAFAELVTVIGRHLSDPDLDAPVLDADGVARLLARPDDPRVALRLATELAARPFDPDEPALVERIVSLQYSLAIAKATSVWGELSKPSQNALAYALSAAPDASDDEAWQLVRSIRDPDGRIEVLWHAVIEEPNDLDRRLVLADALIEQGDPRGQVIALQCRPGGFEEASHLLEARRHELLGNTGHLIGAVSRFAGGLLSSLSVGTVSTPPWVWDLPLDQRELCALCDVSPGYLTAERYAAFLAELPRMPLWVRIERAHLDALKARRAVCAFRNVEFSLWPPPRDLAKELLAIAAYAPSLEGLAIRASHWPPLPLCLEVAREVRERVPGLKRFLVGLLPGHGNPDDVVEAAHASTDLEVVDPPSPPTLAAWW